MRRHMVKRITTYFMYDIISNSDRTCKLEAMSPERRVPGHDLGSSTLEQEIGLILICRGFRLDLLDFVSHVV